MELSEAQELSKKLKDTINNLSRSPDKDPFMILVHLLEECGEASTIVKGLEGKKPKDPSHYSKDELSKEIVDIIHNAFCLAEYYGISVEEVFEKRVDEISKKFEK